jgi:carbonic anhydrase
MMQPASLPTHLTSAPKPELKIANEPAASETSSTAPPSENVPSSDRMRDKTKHFVRTSVDDAVKPIEALQALILGNERFRSGNPNRTVTHMDMRKALVDYGQAPHAAIVGCADSRCPVEALFDAMPGDLFVLRNAGNTCTHAEGSIVGSLEFCIGPLGTNLIVVLGHTNCGAVAGATKNYMANKAKAAASPADGKAAPASALQGLLQDLGSVAEKAHQELGQDASVEAVAAHAVKVNVFHTMDFLLKFSQPIREKIMKGEAQLQGAVYHLETGHVDFLGCSPAQDKLLGSDATLPPSMAPASR